MHVPRPQRRTAKGTTLRSVVVGASATILDLALLAFLVHACAVAPRVASPFALVLGLVAQFVGNKVFAFRDRSRRWGKQAAGFALVEACAFALNALGFDALVATTGLPPVPARLLVSSAVYFLFCLPLWSRVFVARPDGAQARVG